MVSLVGTSLNGVVFIFTLFVSPTSLTGEVMVFAPVGPWFKLTLGTGVGAAGVSSGLAGSIFLFLGVLGSFFLFLPLLSTMKPITISINIISTTNMYT